jgi:hypothetical protein
MYVQNTILELVTPKFPGTLNLLHSTLLVAKELSSALQFVVDHVNCDPEEFHAEVSLCRFQLDGLNTFESQRSSQSYPKTNEGPLRALKTKLSTR